MILTDSVRLLEYFDLFDRPCFRFMIKKIVFLFIKKVRVNLCKKRSLNFLLYIYIKKKRWRAYKFK